MSHESQIFRTALSFYIVSKWSLFLKVSILARGTLDNFRFGLFEQNFTRLDKHVPLEEVFYNNADVLRSMGLGRENDVSQISRRL